MVTNAKRAARTRLVWNDLDEMVATGVARCNVQRVEYNSDDTERVTTVGTVEVHRDKLSDANRARAMMHGIKQRVVDNAALGTVGGVPPSATEKLAALRDMTAHLESGGTEWNVRPSRDPLAGKTAEQLAALIAAAQAKLGQLGIK